MLSDSEVQRVLVIVAHPDDADFSAAGTIAGWTDAGIEVVYCLVTDGDAGGHDDSVPRAEMAPLRRKEQTAAAACVGVSDLRFLGYPDGQVEATLGLRKDLARVIRQVRPDRVVCPSPERNYARIGVSHPDHRAVGSAALDAVYPDARNPYAFAELRDEEGLEPWSVPLEYYYYVTAKDTNYWVNIDSVAEMKLNAALAHVSQWSPAVEHMDKLEEFLRTRLAAVAAAGGLPEGSLAETFQVLDTA